MPKNMHTTESQTLARLTNDPIDALQLVTDLRAMSEYRAERAAALRAGAPTPRAPKPLSKTMRIVTTNVRARVNAIAGLFSADELDRLKDLGPRIAQRLERNDEDLAAEIYDLVCMPPSDAVTWVREHLDEIEARFAS